MNINLGAAASVDIICIQGSNIQADVLGPCPARPATCASVRHCCLFIRTPRKNVLISWWRVCHLKWSCAGYRSGLGTSEAGRNPDPRELNQGTRLMHQNIRRRWWCARIKYPGCIFSGLSKRIPSHHLPNKKGKKKWLRLRPDEGWVNLIHMFCTAWKTFIWFCVLWQVSTFIPVARAVSETRFLTGGRRIMRHEQFAGTLVWPTASRPA